MTFDLSLVGKKTDAARFSYTFKDVALYALGIGAKENELDFVYERRGPKVYPSFAVVPAFEPIMGLLARSGVDMAMVVHGSQKVVAHAPIAPEGVLETRAVVRGIYDLRRFA